MLTLIFRLFKNLIIYLESELNRFAASHNRPFDRVPNLITGRHRIWCSKILVRDAAVLDVRQSNLSAWCEKNDTA